MSDHLASSQEQPQPAPASHERTMPDPEAEQVQAMAERQQALAPRAELARNTFKQAAEQLAQENDSLAADMYRQAAEGLNDRAQQAASSGETIQVPTHIALQLKAQINAGGHRKTWETVNHELETGYDNPHDFAELLARHDIPQLPEASGPAQPVYRDIYRQADRLYLPTKDPGVLLAVTSDKLDKIGPAITEAGADDKAPDFRLDIIMSPDKAGFDHLPAGQTEQALRAQTARHQLGAAMQPQPEQHRSAEHSGFSPGEAVKVRRSDGHIEGGWEVESVNQQTGEAVVIAQLPNGRTIDRHISVAKLREFKDYEVSRNFIAPPGGGQPVPMATPRPEGPPPQPPQPARKSGLFSRLRGGK